MSPHLSLSEWLSPIYARYDDVKEGGRKKEPTKGGLLCLSWSTQPREAQQPGSAARCALSPKGSRRVLIILSSDSALAAIVLYRLFCNLVFILYN